MFLLWVLVSLQVVLVLATTKGLEPPLPKHPHGPVYGPKNLKFCKQNVKCPADHVPYDAVYLTAYIRTKKNDPYTGYYLYLSKRLNQYGQYTLTSKLSDAVIASLNIPVKQDDGYANAGSIKTWNADYHQLPHIGGVLGYGSNSSYILFNGHYNYYALSPTTTTAKYAKPVNGGYSAYAHFTGHNAPKEEHFWSIVYHTDAPGHIYPVWYNPTWGEETYGNLWWIPGTATGGKGFGHGMIAGMTNTETFSAHFKKQVYKDIWPIDMTPHSIHGFKPGKPNQPPP